MVNSPMIRGENITLYYNQRAILAAPKLQIHSGLTMLTGASGQGKSTFLRMLARLNDRVPGYRFDGVVIIHTDKGMVDIHSSKTCLSSLRKNVAFVPQTPHMLPFSIAKNLMLPLQVHLGTNIAEARERMMLTLCKTGLYKEVLSRLDEPARNLSIGQQQRLAVARAMMISPSVLVLDEPTSSLDQTSKESLLTMLRSLAEDTTILMSSHDNAKMLSMADHFLEIRKGRLLCPPNQDG